MTRPRRGYLSFDWGQLHFRAVGMESSRPLLLLLHQSPLSSRRYELALPFLGETVRAMALDFPGYGGSDPPDIEWDVPAFARAIWAVADQVGARQAVLFGRATGSVVALAAANIAPERTLGLILHGFPLYTPVERHDHLGGFAPPYEIKTDGTYLAWIWNRIYEQYPNLEPHLATSLVMDYLACGSDYASAYRAIWRYDPTSALRDLAAPTLLMAGTLDRLFSMHERITTVLPHAQHLVMAEATDYVAEQEPELFAQHLLSFVSSLNL